jgi:hypothetical protein
MTRRTLTIGGRPKADCRKGRPAHALEIHTDAKNARLLYSVWPGVMADKEGFARARAQLRSDDGYSPRRHWRLISLTSLGPGFACPHIPLLLFRRQVNRNLSGACLCHSRLIPLQNQHSQIVSNSCTKGSHLEGHLLLTAPSLHRRPCPQVRRPLDFRSAHNR